jgi:hypothetical protein
MAFLNVATSGVTIFSTAVTRSPDWSLALPAGALGSTPSAGSRKSPAEIDSYLSGMLLSRVLPAAFPPVAEYDLDAPAHVRLWQCGILRDCYLIRRGRPAGP